MSESRKGPAVILNAENIILSSLRGARLSWMGSLEASARGGRFFIIANRPLGPDELNALRVLEIPVAGFFVENEEQDFLMLTDGDFEQGTSGKIRLSRLLVDPESPDVPYQDSVTRILDEGILPEALINALILTAWDSRLAFNVFTRAQIRSLYQAGALLPEDTSLSYRQLLKINATHLRRTPPRELMPFVREALAADFPSARDHSDGWMAWATQLLQDKMTLVSDAPKLGRFLFSLDTRDFTEGARVALEGKSSRVILQALAEALEAMTHFNGEENRKMLKSLKAALKKLHGITGKAIDRAIEAALTGQQNDHPLADVITLLGKETCADRIAQALTMPSGC